MKPFAEAEEGVTIVIPTRDRPKLLNRIIDTIKVQYREVDFEVEIFVVCDGNEEAFSRAWLDEEGPDNTPRIEPIQIKHKRFRPSMLRNVAAGSAHYEQLILLDDDCVPKEGWLEAYREAFDNQKLLYGKIDYVDPETGEDGHTHPKDCNYHWEAPEAFWTGNVSIPRSVFFTLGGMHPVFDKKDQVGEGAEFALRADAAGYDIKHVPEAEVEHQGLRKQSSVRLEEMEEESNEEYHRLAHKWKDR